MTAILSAHGLVIVAFGFGLFLAYRRQGVLALGFTFVVAVAWMYLASTMLGRPLPLSEPPHESAVLSMAAVPNEAIYLWLVEEGSHEPLSVRLPWSNEQAQKLSEQLEAQGEKGGAVRFKKPGIPGEPGEFRLELPPEPTPKTPMQEYGE
jgi:hypothetical protein